MRRSLRQPTEMAIQSAVACSEAKDDGLLVSCQLMERILVWVVSFSLAVEDGFLFIMDKSFTGLIQPEKAQSDARISRTPVGASYK